MDELLKRKKPKTKENRIKMTFIVIFWLIIWEIADRIIDNKIVLSGPVHIVQALVRNMGQADFWAICTASFFRIAIGFILSFVAGFVLAVVCYKFSLIRDFLEPIIVTLKTVPMISLDRKSVV